MTNKEHDGCEGCIHIAKANNEHPCMLCKNAGNYNTEDMWECEGNIDHPSHYGGADNPYEAIKVIDAWGLGFSLGNAVKYISRAGKKNGNTKEQDLKKAIWYLQHELERSME